MLPSSTSGEPSSFFRPQANADATTCRYSLLFHAPRANFAAGGAFRKGYLFSAGYLGFMMITYPICWACSEGANVISPTSEMIWYGILDVLSIPAFLLFFLFQLRTVDYAAFGFQSGKFTDHTVPAVRATKAQEAGEAGAV